GAFYVSSVSRDSFLPHGHQVATRDVHNQDPLILGGSSCLSQHPASASACFAGSTCTTNGCYVRTHKARITCSARSAGKICMTSSATSRTSLAAAVGTSGRGG